LNLESFIPQSAAEWQITLLFFLVLAVVLVISEIISRIFKLPKEFPRKFIHIAVGLLVVLFSFYLTAANPLLFLCALFTIANFFIKKYNLLPAMQSERETYGTIYYPLAILISTLLFWDNYRFIFVNVVLIMALSDAFAAVVGQAVKNPVKYRVWEDWKSLQGSFAFFLITMLIILLTNYGMRPLTGSNSHFSIYILALCLSLVITMAESISVKGSDNFSITLVAGFFFYIFFYCDVYYQSQFIEAILLAMIIALVSIRLHFLNIDGAISTAMMAMFIFGIGGWQWTIPVLTFFISSSILSKIGHSKKQHFRLLFEKSSKRDSKQVFANGGLALLIIVVYFFTSQDIFFYLYLASLAAANADTWATELGVFSISRPRLLTTFKRVEKGSSGAISFAGSSAAFLGSLAVVHSGLFFKDLSLSPVLILTLCGLLATFIDSLLGATLQAQYQSADRITEKAFDESGQPHQLIRGLKWLNNDLVNFLSILCAPLIYLCIKYFFS
jgi:uncharacterized protein (TIGR00297 family)